MQRTYTLFISCLCLAAILTYLMCLGENYCFGTSSSSRNERSIIFQHRDTNRVLNDTSVTSHTVPPMKYPDTSAKPSFIVSSTMATNKRISTELNKGIKTDVTKQNVWYRGKIKIMRFRKVSCEPLYPEVLLYNRIFKTGSSTITAYVQDITNGTNITVKAGTTEDWYKTGDSWPYPENIEKYGQKDEMLVYIAHFFFRRKLDLNRPYTYINVFREPVDRVVSHYHYMRNAIMRPKRRIRKLKQSGLWNETLLDCVQNQHRGCEDNVMTLFICGTASFCKTGSSKALARAKRNLKTFYACVGTLENMDYFTRILPKRLPSFFTKPYKITKVKVNSKRPHSENETVLSIIRNRNKADIELYKLVQELEKKQIQACGLV